MHSCSIAGCGRCIQHRTPRHRESGTPRRNSVSTSADGSRPCWIGGSPAIAPQLRRRCALMGLRHTWPISEATVGEDATASPTPPYSIAIVGMLGILEGRENDTPGYLRPEEGGILCLDVRSSMRRSV